jgi:phage replication O-like protein O
LRFCQFGKRREKVDSPGDEHSSIPFLKHLFSHCDSNGKIQIGFYFKNEYLQIGELDSLPLLLAGHREEKVFFGISAVNERMEIPAIGIRVSAGEDKRIPLKKIKGFPLGPTFTVDSGDSIYSFWKLKGSVIGEFPGVQDYKKKVKTLFGKGGILTTTGRLPGTFKTQIVQEFSFPDAEYSLADLETGFLLGRSSPKNEKISRPAPDSLPEGIGEGQGGEHGNEGSPGQEDQEVGSGGKDPPPQEKVRTPQDRPELHRVDEFKGANPQAENGHIDIAHEIAEAFFNLQLSGNQWRLLWVILRQTYGWKKKVDKISLSFFERKTGLDRRNIAKLLKDMIKRNIIVKNDTTFITTYGFQKDYTKWKPVSKLILVSDRKELSSEGKNSSEDENHCQKSHSSKLTTKSLSKITPTKENQKKIYCPENFEPFYKAYPNKKARSAAEKAWAKLNPSPELIQTILNALENQKRSEDWQKEGGKYIPYPGTWINGRRWEDEVKEAKPSW